jgi:DNA invertase Pin-like site-specific DNA recombinase
VRVAIYARVSTNEEKALQDPETQLMILRDWARAGGHEVHKEYVDRASGKSAEGRERFKEMMKAAEAKEFQGVAVLRLDRFMRDSIEGMQYAKRLQAAGCRLVLVKDDFLGQVDASTPIGEFLLTLIFAIGQLERKQTAEKVREGIARFKHQRGRWGRQSRKDINVQIAGELLKVMSLSEAARFLKVPRNTLREHLERAGVQIPTAGGCRNTGASKTDPSSNTAGRE